MIRSVQRRVALLRQHGFDQIETWLDQRRGTGIGTDDLSDAYARWRRARALNESQAASEELEW